MVSFALLVGGTCRRADPIYNIMYEHLGCSEGEDKRINSQYDIGRGITER